VAIDHLGSIAKGFGDTTVTPTTFVINKRGEVVKRYVGEPDFGQLERLIAELLVDA
jgi:protein-disulfide isomerase